MIPVTAAYKNEVYTTQWARHFIPQAGIGVIDTLARRNIYYEVNTEAFYSQQEQLWDMKTRGSFDYGTLEDFQFLLDGTKRIMPVGALRTGQYGYGSEWMTQSDGAFVQPVVMTCFYTQAIDTVGRMLYFDTNYDSVAKDFDIEYYLQGVLVHTTFVRNNSLYVYISTEDVQGFDKVIIRFYSMTRPFRRLHLVEDVSGIYLEFDETQIVSINYLQQVDVLSKEILSSELDLMLENFERLIDLMNPDGFEQYLQRGQSLEAKLGIVYRDYSVEWINLGNLSLYDWKVNKGTLTASFTARDNTDLLSLGEYIYGQFPTTPQSLYQYAQEVLQQAGVEKYTIDSELNSIFTLAPLPLGTFKEVLRQIAQAALSVVVCEVDGTIHVKYYSPLMQSANIVQNPSFSADFTSWEQNNCALDTTQIYYGRQSVKTISGSSLQQAITLNVGHKYYIRMYCNPVTSRLQGTSAGIYLNEELISPNLIVANLQAGQWAAISVITVASQESNFLSFQNLASEINVDCFLVIDLTATYGASQEPDKEWCDKNLRYFEGSLKIPRAQEPAPVDNLDYSILMESPEIAARQPIKSITTNVYNYKVATDVTEVYTGDRIIKGTEEFSFKFSQMAKNCQISVQTVDDDGQPTAVNGATLLEYTLFAQAAIVKILADGKVNIKVTGNAVQASLSQFGISNILDHRMQDKATEESIDNPLITDVSLAEDVTAYASFWYSKKFDYDYTWRQNPAIELLDPVQVQDDFGRNNTVLTTERTIDYTNGVLGGSSRGIF